jgi:hypothetical protein
MVETLTKPSATREREEIIEIIGSLQRLDRLVSSLIRLRLRWNVIPGSSVPSMCTCSSHFGIPSMKAVSPHMAILLPGYPLVPFSKS